MKIHDNYKIGNIIDIHKYFKNGSYDVVIALDLVEYITKKEGLKLIEDREKIAKKKVIILTPNGYYHQEPYENNPYQVHKSGWFVKDFKKRGFKLFGMRGLKYLRGEQATLKFKPWFLWGVISTITQYITYFIPGAAYQLLAVKTK